MFLFVKHKCPRLDLRVSIAFDILLIILNDDEEENIDFLAAILKPKIIRARNTAIDKNIIKVFLV